MPASSENAAPLYLEAFVEFDGASAEYFPLARRATAVAAQAKWTKWLPIYAAWESDPGSVPAKQLDAILADFKEGFRKLDLAQRRPRCVFALGMSRNASMTEVPVTRSTGRLLTLRAVRALDRGDFAGAIDDISRMLRLTRDLRPRGDMVSQLVAVAVDSMCIEQSMLRILAHPKLKVEHCDRLLKLLSDHESRAEQSFVTGVMGGYVTMRSTLRDFEDGIFSKLNDENRPVDTKLNRAGVTQMFILLGEELSGQKVNPELLKDPAFLEKAQEKLDQLNRESKAAHQAADDYARTLIAAPSTYRARMQTLAQLDKTHITGKPPTLFSLTKDDYLVFAQACAKDTAKRNAAKCLIALSRWQLTHSTPPPDLAAACRDAKLAEVPTDPFSNSPLKLATIDGDLVVYSVGPDEVDDRGLKDLGQGQKTDGDILYRLPKRK